MTRLILSAAASLALLGAAASPVSAAPCKDAKGRFVKCAQAKKTPVRCKDAKGKFAKCGAAGAKPM